MDTNIEKLVDHIDKNYKDEIVSREFVKNMAKELNLTLDKETIDKVLTHFGVNPIDESQQTDVIPEPPGGVDKAKPGSTDKYPEIFKPSLFKTPMHKSVHERRILDFEGFMKRLNYRTHDGQSDETTQRGHGQNLTGK